MVKFWICVKTAPIWLDDMLDVACKRRGMIKDSKIWGPNKGIKLTSTEVEKLRVE